MLRNTWGSASPSHGGKLACFPLQFQELPLCVEPAAYW
jgi:hypothetical protein